MAQVSESLVSFCPVFRASFDQLSLQSLFLPPAFSHGEDDPAPPDDSFFFLPNQEFEVL